ncbi:Os05g0250866 [Oryza sativa Japonica Group]|uniref:Os05g0250866 protein n=1 Tax=Oryza sativa subsp. japonica TaxID=39947 RepID=A0A0N7KKE9_ORYSJ|nr:hypothetical protein EE612_028133 [Oryza sativa]BAS93025.1 Os05g0250866 [Oryza sativa Japonica Group]
MACIPRATASWRVVTRTRLPAAPWLKGTLSRPLHALSLHTSSSTRKNLLSLMASTSVGTSSDLLLSRPSLAPPTETDLMAILRSSTSFTSCVTLNHIFLSNASLMASSLNTFFASVVLPIPPVPTTATTTTAFCFLFLPLVSIFTSVLVSSSIFSPTTADRSSTGSVLRSAALGRRGAAMSS